MTTKRLLACALAALVGGILVAKADYFSYNLHGRLEDSVTRFNKQAANLLPIPRGYLAGCTMSVSSSTVLQITGCYSVDSTNVVVMNQTSTFTKSTGGAWTAGTGNNGMGTGLTVSNSTWYHVFQILNGGLVDYYLDTSVTAANAPAGTTAFRRIGSVKTGASTAPLTAFSQQGDEFLWATAVAEINGSTGNVAALANLTGIPPGIENIGKFRYIASGTSSSAGVIYSTDAIVGTVASPAGNTNIFFPANSQVDGEVWVRTSAGSPSQIGFNFNVSATLQLVTYGWLDTRGRNN